MKKLLEEIQSAIDDLRKCGLAIPEAVNAKRLLKTRHESDFLNEDGLNDNSILCSVMYFLASEDFMNAESVPVGSRGCDLDDECIYRDGDYAELVRKIEFLAGADSDISDLRDWVDVPRDDVLLKFEFKGKEHYFNPCVDRDWADVKTTRAIMRLVSKKGYGFYQLCMSGLYYLKPSVSKRIQKLDPKIDLDAVRFE